MAAADSKVKSVSSSAPISSRPTMFESHPGRETVSSIIETDDRVNNPVAGSSLAGGAKIESNWRVVLFTPGGEPLPSGELSDLRD
jgi:hypothetical protein